MASKLQIITATYENEVIDCASSNAKWTAFLSVAAKNYKYSFQDQVLIYAQRPDATACAEISFWNERMNRWVNKGAKGIALLDNKGDTSSGESYIRIICSNLRKYCLQHYLPKVNYISTVRR